MNSELNWIESTRVGFCFFCTFFNANKSTTLWYYDSGGIPNRTSYSTHAGADELVLLCWVWLLGASSARGAADPSGESGCIRECRCVDQHHVSDQVMEQITSPSQLLKHFSLIIRALMSTFFVTHDDAGLRQMIVSGWELHPNIFDAYSDAIGCSD